MICGRLDTDQCRVDARESELHLGQFQFGLQTTHFFLECVDLRWFGGSWLGRAPQRAGFQGFQGRLQRLVAQGMEPGLADPQPLAGLGNRQLPGDRLQDHLQPLFRRWGALQAFGNLRTGWLPSRSGRVHGTSFLE